MAISPDVPNPGLAEFTSDTITGGQELLAGDTPRIVTHAGTYTAAQAAAGIPKNTPVICAFDGGPITLPVDGGDKPNAITVGTLKPGGTTAGSMGVYKAGCFNSRALAWPAHLDTEAERLGAFDLASSQIYVKTPVWA